VSNHNNPKTSLYSRDLTATLIDQVADVVSTILKVVFLPDYDNETKDEPRQDMGYPYPVDGEHQESF
jgi:hypothetical protein